MITKPALEAYDYDTRMMHKELLRTWTSWQEEVVKKANRDDIYRPEPYVRELRPDHIPREKFEWSAVNCAAFAYQMLRSNLP